jgi:Ran GTPase-activating protein (RanGAP) involved in mRNA processing and transport
MGNKIGPEGAKSVGELLKINNTLTQLVMCDNEMKAEGATALADGLKSNSDLLCLHVFGCSLGQAGGKAVVEALKTNETLDEVLVGSLMVGCTVRLKSSGEEKVVTRYDSSDGILYEGKTNSWTKYSEFDTILAVLPAKQLRENTIETLDLSNMGLGIDGGLMLAALMAGNGSLRCLNVMGNDLRAAGAQAVSEMLKANKTVRKVDLSDNQIGGFNTGPSYDLKFNPTPEGPAALADALKSSALQCLNVMGNKIGPEGAKPFGELLKTNNTLTQLVMCDNEMKAEGATALADGLKSNSDLLCLHVFSNEIPEDTLRAIMNSNGSIRTFGGAAKLDFSGKGLDSADVKVLAELLKDNKTATCLNVSSNDLKKEGMAALKELLLTSSTLAEINLSANAIVGSGGQPITDQVVAETSFEWVQDEPGVILRK